MVCSYGNYPGIGLEKARTAKLSAEPGAWTDTA